MVQSNTSSAGADDDKSNMSSQAIGKNFQDSKSNRCTLYRKFIAFTLWYFPNEYSLSLFLS